MRRNTARLLYDSARSGASVGVRSAVVEGRTLVFRCSRMSVDVVVHGGEDELGFIHGQVIREADGSPVCGARVRVGEEEAVETDDCGHFALPTSDLGVEQVLRLATAEQCFGCTIPALDGADVP